MFVYLLNLSPIGILYIGISNLKLKFDHTFENDDQAPKKKNKQQIEKKMQKGTKVILPNELEKGRQRYEQIHRVCTKNCQLSTAPHLSKVR
jgi:hypothetical protein